MLQVFGDFLTSIFYNYPEKMDNMKGGGLTKIRIIQKSSPKQKIVIKQSNTSITEKLKNFIKKEEPVSEETDFEVDNDSEDIPEKEVSEGPLIKASIAEVFDDTNKFELLNNTTKNVIDVLSLEALKRRYNKLLSKKETVENGKELELLNLEIEYIEIVNSSRQIENIIQPI
jgi:hypothetical protein